VEVHAPGEDEARSLVSCSTEFTRKDTQRRRIVSRRLVAVLHTRNRKRNAGAICASLIRTLSAIFELKCSVQGTLSRVQHFLRPTLIARAAVLPLAVTYI
jgi:hypothetical protein